jgi:hypothetical protein
LLYAAIIRAENETLFDAFTVRMLDAEAGELQLSILRRDERESEESRLIDEVLEAANVANDARESLKRLCLAWLSQMQLGWARKTRYSLKIADAAENLTWKEFDEALALWNKCQDTATLLEFLADRAKSDGRQEKDLLDELLAALTDRYNGLLEDAASSFLLSEHEARICEAESIAALIEVLARTVLDANSRRVLFLRFLGVVRTWGHFDVNPADARIRAREVQILTEMLDAAGDDWEAYAAAVYELRDRHTQGPRALIKALLPLLSKFNHSAVQVIERLMLERGAVITFIGSEGRDFLKAALMDVYGPVWSPPGSSPLERLLKQAAGDVTIQANARMLLEQVAAERLPYLDDGALRAAFAQDQRVMAALWDAAVAQQIQFRMLQSIRDIRIKLVNEGIPGAVLVEPPWLAPPAIH